MKKLVTIIALMMSLNAFTCSEDGSSGFIEENDMFIPVDAKNLGGITEEQFNDVITKIETIYSPIVSNMGGKLNIARKWTDGTVNANASRKFGGTWHVNMYGGLARHETITQDGFALVLCHELGHHLGGAPKVGNFLMKWASNEGQSDYFASLKCLRKAFLNDNNSEIVSAMTIPATLKKECTTTYKNKDEQNVCMRIGMAGMSVANLFASMRNASTPSFDTPDPKVVTTTDHAHPAYQCRLDTYFQGAICDISFNDDVSQKDETVATCHGANGHTKGLRPLCWFKPSK